MLNTIKYALGLSLIVVGLLVCMLAYFDVLVK